MTARVRLVRSRRLWVTALGALGLAIVWLVVAALVHLARENRVVLESEPVGRVQWSQVLRRDDVKFVAVPDAKTGVTMHPVFETDEQTIIMVPGRRFLLDTGVALPVGTALTRERRGTGWTYLCRRENDRRRCERISQEAAIPQRDEDETAQTSNASPR